MTKIKKSKNIQNECETDEEFLTTKRKSEDRKNSREIVYNNSQFH